MNDTQSPPPSFDPDSANRSAGCLSPKIILGCGCGGFLIFAVMIAIAMKLGYDGLLPQEPLDFPAISASEEEKQAMLDRVQSTDSTDDGVHALTPEQLSLLAQAGLGLLMKNGTLGEASKVRVDLVGPKKDRIQVRVSASFPDTNKWFSGRFFNFEATGFCKVQAGEVEELEIDEFAIGTMTTGEKLDRETAIETFKAIRSSPWTPQISWEFLDRIDTLQVVDGKIEFKFRP